MKFFVQFMWILLGWQIPLLVANIITSDAHSSVAAIAAWMGFAILVLSVLGSLREEVKFSLIAPIIFPLVIIGAVKQIAEFRKDCRDSEETWP